MKKIAAIILILSFLNLSAQEYKFRDNIDKDSLFNISVKKLPEIKREEYIKTYNEGSAQTKEFLLFMISMPQSGKKELIENYENKHAEILTLLQEYRKFIPENYIVDVEFEPESKILTMPEQISIKIYRAVNQGDKLDVISRNWNLEKNSEEMGEILKSINWTSQTLTEVQRLLKNANCISIKNGQVTTIGYARSGMGQYSYKIFENPLTPEQKKQYDNGCEYIYYKENIVLEYGGGAIGPQCFEKK